MSTTRLNKHIALVLGLSRRQADDLIAAGDVVVDGEVAVLGARLQPGSQVAVKGTPLPKQVAYHTIMLNKPVGYVCSRKQQGSQPTIYSLLPPELHTLKPVGRLDADSSGLLLLSNNGDFAYRMTHPQFAKVKEYHVRLDHPLEPLHQQMISDYGIQLADGTSRLILTRLRPDSRTEWHISMSEGRNRQIRRTFAALGYTVVRLHRTHFGSYSLGKLPRGEWQNVAEQ